MGAKDNLVRDFERENHVILDAEKQVKLEDRKKEWYLKKRKKRWLVTISKSNLYSMLLHYLLFLLMSLRY